MSGRIPDSIRGQKCSGPGGCGHALSAHNDLGYCRNHSKRDGWCQCGESGADKLARGETTIQLAFAGKPAEDAGAES